MSVPDLKKRIDSHCHIDLYPDYRQLIDEINEQQIATIAVTTTPSVYERCVEITNGSKFIRVALGLHPELAFQRHRELGLFKELLHKTRYVGEIGLDFVTTDDEHRTIQRQVFDSILSECASYGDKVLTLHSRRAAAEVVTMVGADYPGKVILHWFSGPMKVLDTALSNGLYFSVNPAMFQSASGRRIIEAIPRHRMLTETDGPFVNLQGHSARPQDVRNVLLDLAKLWKIDAVDVAENVYQNFRTCIATTESPASS